MNKDNLWTALGAKFRDYTPDYHLVDELFTVDNGGQGGSGGSKGPGNTSNGGMEGSGLDTKKKKENTEVRFNCSYWNE